MVHQVQSKSCSSGCSCAVCVILEKAPSPAKPSPVWEKKLWSGWKWGKRSFEVCDGNRVCDELRCEGGQEDGWEAAPGHGGALRGSSNESLGWGTRWTCSAGSVPLRQSGPDLGEIRENTPVGFGRFWDGVLKSSKKINRISAVLMWAS